MKFRHALAVLAVFALGIVPALAAGFWSNMPSASFPLTGVECSGFDTALSGGQTPQTECITTNQLSIFAHAPVALTSVASTTTDASLGRLFTLTLATSGTLNSPTNVQAGASYQWIITNTASNYTLNYGSAFTWSGGSAPTVTTGAKDSLIRCWAKTTTVLRCDSVLNY